MSNSSAPVEGRAYPPFHRRVLSVWFRHVVVYGRNIFSNGLPPFLEPLIFLVGIGLGLGRYIDEMGGVPYLQYLATGLMISTAMFTASFETTFSTFIRLEFDKVYDGILSGPLSVADLFLGEMLWTGTKGLFFSFAVFVIVSVFRILDPLSTIFIPIIGFFAGAMFGAMGLLVTSFVKTINHFNFYLTGIISPMFFFSGVVFPLENLPPWVRPISEALPLTHPVRMARAISFGRPDPILAFDVAYIIVVTAAMGLFAIRRLKKRLIA